MNIIDTRDLIEEREELKEQILESFLETFEHYTERTKTFEDILLEEEEIQSWKEYWGAKLASISEINDLEYEIGSEFEHGVTLIDEQDFTEYCEELLEDIGYIPKDFPSWIAIDWKATAKNVKLDYSEVEFRGTNYYYRA